MSTTMKPTEKSPLLPKTIIRRDLQTKWPPPKLDAIAEDEQNGWNGELPPAKKILHQPTIASPRQRRTGVTRLHSRPKIPWTKFTIARASLICIINVIVMCAVTICLPLAIDAMVEAGSTSYMTGTIVCMWYPIILGIQILFIKLFVDKKLPLVPSSPWSALFLAGAGMGISNVLTANTAIPSRTPPYLQAILQTMSIPITVIGRLILLRKGINRRQTICIVTLLLGLIVSLQPTIFNMNADVPQESLGAWYYPVIFVFAMFPTSLSFIYMERSVKGHEDETMIFTFWYFIFLYASYIFMFWVDFIPDFGMATGVPDFLAKLVIGFRCFYEYGISCSYVTVRGFIFIISFTLMCTLNVLIMKYTEGSIFVAIVSAFAMPVSTLFWYLFEINPNLHWAPHVDITLLFVVLGLVIMLPSIVLYAYFGDQQEKQIIEEERNRFLERAKRRIFRSSIPPAKKTKAVKTESINERSV